jgi:NitT/TauT family transport system permease protein
MVWSIIFGTINGVETIPDDIKKAAEAHGITGTRYLKNELIPAIYPSLITGCLLAVGGGWYFLIACEFITLGEQNYTLPGIGYYLQRAAYDANFVCAIFGLIVLICLIYALNKLIWYPLISYSSKYRYETVGTLDVEELEKNPLPRFLKRITKGILNGLITIEDFFHNLNIKPQTLRRIKTVVKWAFYCVGAVIVGWIASFMVFASTGFVNDLINTTTKHPEASQIFYFAVRSFTRLAAGYLIALAIALSVGITVAMSPRLTKIFTPVFDIGQSVPALALFPIIVVLFINFLNGSPIALEISSVILLLTGMQWYLLFNVMSAVRGIPNDIFEAGRAYGLSKFQLVRHIVFPAIFSRTVFGSMEAWGGGWNATIVSEYVLYGGQVYWVPGLGALLNFSAAVWDSVPMVVITIIMMAAIILLMNELLWQRLIKWGTRFNIEM